MLRPQPLAFESQRNYTETWANCSVILCAVYLPLSRVDFFTFDLIQLPTIRDSLDKPSIDDNHTERKDMVVTAIQVVMNMIFLSYSVIVDTT